MLIPFGILSAAAGLVGRVGVAGYFAGGVAQATTVDKFAFPSDTRTTLGTGISLAKYWSRTMSDTGTAGYSSGGNGNSGGLVDTVDKFAFPSDTRTSLGTGLSSARGEHAGMANSGVAGYFGGGQTPSTITTVDKFAFPSDSRTTLATGLSAARNGLSGFADEGVF